MSKLASKLVGIKSRKRIEMKRKRGICINSRCTNLARHQRLECNSCRSRKYYEKHPLRRLFLNLKCHAKARGKTFCLDFSDFVRRAVESGYNMLHGRGASDLHVDRIDPSRGYEPDNIQFITNSENSRKAWAERNGWSWENKSGG